MIDIMRTTSAHQDFATLVRQLDAALRARYGAAQDQYDRHNRLDTLDTVVLAYVDEGTPGRAAVGCGALRPYDPTSCEIKRMYVAPAYRRRGIAGQLLRELETWAAELGFARAILETGAKQVEAIGLYRKHGYQPIANYGPYVDHPMSVCLEKEFGRPT